MIKDRKKYKTYRVGETKVVEKFLIFPRFTKEKMAWLGRYNLTYILRHSYVYVDGLLCSDYQWELIDITR